MAKEQSGSARRQAAYRERRNGPPMATLAALARTLHGVIQEAAKAGDPQAQAVAGEGRRADETLKNLAAHFRAKVDE